MPDNGLPVGWRIARLGDVATVETGGTPSRQRPDYWGGEVRWMSSGEVNQRRVKDTAETITEAGVASSNAKVFPPGTLMLALNGQGKTRGKVAVLEVEAACNQSLAAIRGRNGIESQFLLHDLDSRYEELRRLTGDDARNGLNLGILRSLRFAIPPLDEQRRIAEVLDSIDAAIEKTEAVIAATERLRSALLGELLTRGVPGWHTEWKQVPGIGTIPACWDVVRLGEVLADGPDNGLYKHESDYGSGVWIIRITDFSPGRLERTSFERVRATAEEVQAYAVAEGDILINRVNSLSHIGKSVLLPRLAEPAIFESNMMKIRVTARLLPEYAIEVLCSPATRRYFLARAKKAVAQASINQTDIRQLMAPLPPGEEQQALVSTISSLNARLAADAAALDNLAELKKSAAANLLSGRVRITAGGQA